MSILPQVPGLGPPALYLPFPTVVHPLAQHAAARSVAWMDRFCLYGNPEQRDRLVRSGCGLLGAYLTPAAPVERLQVIADFAMWNIAFDDEYCDEGELGRAPERFVRVLSLIHRALEIPEAPFYGEDRYAAAMRDIRMRLEPLADPARLARWVEAMRGWFLAEAWKSGNVARAAVPSLSEYATLTLYSGSAEVWTVLCPIIEGYVVPDGVRAQRPVRALTEMACVLVAWDTGFVSYDKEHRGQSDGHNLIDVVAHEFGGGVQPAVSRALALRDRIMGLFLRLREDLLAQGEPLLDRYIATLERLMRGGVDWSLASARYREAGASPEAVAVRPVGFADRPSDTATHPPGIASIDWWWRYDPARR